MSQQLRQACQQFQAWFVDTVLPLWLAQQTSLNYLHPAKLKLNGTGRVDLNQPSSSLLNQINTFALAHQQAWHRSLSERAITVLWREMAQRSVVENRADGYLNTLTPNGGSAVRICLAKDHAAAITASCAAYDALGKYSDMRRSYNILRWMDRRLVHPAGGYYESDELPETRFGATQLAVAECLLALANSTGDRRCLQRAQGLIEKVITHLWNDQDLRIYSAFDANWCPSDADQGESAGVSVAEQVAWVNAFELYQNLSQDAGLLEVPRLSQVREALTSKLRSAAAQPHQFIVELTALASLGLRQLGEGNLEDWEAITEGLMQRLASEFGAPNAQSRLAVDIARAEGERAYASSAGLLALCKLACTATQFINSSTRV